MEERWKIRSWYEATLSSLGPVRFLENHRHKLCMQVVGIVRPLTSAGPDDKLLHIQIFGANEGTKFEYRSSRFSFSRLSLSLSLYLSHEQFFCAFPLLLCHSDLPEAHNDSLIWFIERFLSCEKRTCIRGVTFFPACLRYLYILSHAGSGTNWWNSGILIALYFNCVVLPVLYLNYYMCRLYKILYLFC